MGKTRQLPMLALVLAPLAPLAAHAGVLNVFDIIPTSLSAETAQDSEPSLAVNPVLPQYMIAGSFGGNQGAYFATSNGGATWGNFGQIPSLDKSLAWSVDGRREFTTRLLDAGNGNTAIAVQSNDIGPSFGDLIHVYNPGRSLDQPWIRTGRGLDPVSNTTKDRLYIGVNDLNNSGGNTATVHMSTDGGTTWSNTIIDRVGGSAGQDSPAVRLAVNGDKVYAAFIRWNTPILQNDADGIRVAAQVVVVRDDHGATGASKFQALGSSGNGAVVGSTISAFTNTTTGDNGPLALGNERAGSDLAIAVDPNNANRVFVAYTASPASGQIRLIVQESTDGGATWSAKVILPAAARTSQPALAVLANGGVGLLYNAYDASSNLLSQHLLVTRDDFATVKDLALAAFKNGAPALKFDPYVGDFFDLTAVGNTYYGVFSASNLDDGVNAAFPNGVLFQRSFSGTPGTSTFQLNDGLGGTVGGSIDPYFFSYDGSQGSTARFAASVPELSSWAMMIIGFGSVALQVRRRREVGAATA